MIPGPHQVDESHQSKRPALRFPPPTVALRHFRARLRWPSRRDIAPLALVGIAIGFNLWVLRSQRLAIPYLNDGAVHSSMVRWANHRIHEGHLPLDGWYPYFGFGAARFHRYQSLPHIITGYASTLFGADRTYAWSVYLLVSFWPISVYWGARLLGWDRWTAALAGLASPLISSVRGNGYEYGSYVWQGWGTWAQLWGMWMLPVAWGLSWRAVARKGSFALASIAIALTIAFHYLTGYLALLSVGVWVLLRPSAFLKRLGRAAIVVAGSLLIAAWVLVPLLADRRWIPQNRSFVGTFYYDSFGAKRILRWLATGRLFDFHRFPVLTMLGVVGVLVCVRRVRRDERARAILGVGALSMLLYFGRPTLGPLLRLVPGSGDLFLNRFVMGVHLAGIIVVGVGLAEIGRLVVEAGRRYARRIRPEYAVAALVVLAAAVLTPAWIERGHYANKGTIWLARQQRADASEGAAVDRLIAKAAALGPGRVYAGLLNGWGRNNRVGFVPLYAWLQYRNVDSVGFTRPTASLAAQIETHFDDRNKAQYNLFDIRYLILPADQLPDVPATFVERQGRHVLWQVPTSGYVQVVDTTTAITASRTDPTAMQGFLESRLLERNLFPTVRFDGEPPAPPTTRPGSTPVGNAGRVLREFVDLRDGLVRADVVLRRRAMVMLKSSFDPRWRVAVDGTPLAPQMVAPAFVGRTIGPGRHSVVFTYAAYPAYWALFLVALAAIVVLVMARRLVAGELPGGPRPEPWDGSV